MVAKEAETHLHLVAAKESAGGGQEVWMTNKHDTDNMSAENLQPRESDPGETTDVLGASDLRWV